MKKLTVLILLGLASFAFAQQPKVLPGIETLEKNDFSILKGKKVGLITNPTGMDTKLKSTVDILYDAKEVNLVALYGPEHGVRGDYEAGAHVDFYIDEYTNLPVYSLYGKSRKPSPEMLKDIDVLVYDIQDNGCRSYTFISTMGLAMEAAAENGKEFVVLDRPNPLGGNRIEGNITEDGFISFVSQFKIPYVYGLTCGELAKMLNEEGMLKNGVKCNLTVVPMEGWQRDMTFMETGLQWAPASPHVPFAESSFYYVCTGILGELGAVSEGVGYTLPFHLFAADWIKPKDLADKMNSYNIQGVMFRPIILKPFYGKWAKQDLRGVQIHITDFSKVNLMSLQFLFMQANNELYPDKNPFTIADPSRLNMFDKVCGSDYIRTTFMKDMKYDSIKDYLNKDVESFKQKSEKYYIYK